MAATALLPGIAAMLLTRGTAAERLSGLPFALPVWLFYLFCGAADVFLGASAYVLWSAGGFDIRTGMDNGKLKSALGRGNLGLYVALIAVNLVWFVTAFTLSLELLAFAFLIVTVFICAVTTFRFFKVSRGAGLFMLVYLLRLLLVLCMNFLLWFGDFGYSFFNAR